MGRARLWRSSRRTADFFSAVSHRCFFDIQLGIHEAFLQGACLEWHISMHAGILPDGLHELLQGRTACASRGRGNARRRGVRLPESRTDALALLAVAEPLIGILGGRQSGCDVNDVQTAGMKAIAASSLPAGLNITLLSSWMPAGREGLRCRLRRSHSGHSAVSNAVLVEPGRAWRRPRSWRSQSPLLRMDLLAPSCACQA